jgi:hypothetical protein
MFAELNISGLPPARELSFNGFLPSTETSGVDELDLVTPIMLNDTTNSVGAVIHPFLKNGFAWYPLGYGSVIGSGLEVRVELPFNRDLVAGEQLKLTVTFSNSALTSSHTIQSPTISAGTGNLNWSTFDANVGNYDLVRFRLEDVKLIAPLMIISEPGNGFRLDINNTVTNHKTLTYAPTIQNFGPSKEEFQALDGLVGTNSHTLAGLCLWVVARPSATDSSTITMGTATPSEVDEPFINREDILRYCSRGNVLMNEGRLGGIGIAFPLDVASYLDPDYQGQTLRNIYATLSFSSQSASMRVDVQWGICIASSVRNIWLPRPRISFAGHSLEAIFGLCGQMDSVYENKNHVRDIKRQLLQAWNSSTGRKVRDAAAVAYKYGKPIAEAALPLLMSM